VKPYSPTYPLAWWWGGETILGGKDGLGGGTWLGSTRNGRIAFLTNFREVQTLPHLRSRGDLPLRFLQVNPRIALHLFVLSLNKACSASNTDFKKFKVSSAMWDISYL